MATEPSVVLGGPTPACSHLARGVWPPVPPRNRRWVTPSCQLTGASHLGHDSFQSSECPHSSSSPKSLAQGPQRNKAQPPCQALRPSGGLGHRDPQSWLISRQSRREAARLLRSKSQLRHLLARRLGTAYPHTVPSAPQAGLSSVVFPATSPAPAQGLTLSEHQWLSNE